ncbi:hypothetical protein EKM02_10555 [Flavobacterium sp. RSP49]|uniref:hypothetical protein n=1 Tax=unclassified Flavobacterium TaxID=196869 RepID=UPI000F82A481|nr:MULTISPECIES: hypothetical protein [unclassified Flavobacterium]RTY88282.1 hypothetical protein EKM00_03775 [Flavobacterium sp. RSP15]RTY99096.1 hypothetical protein EKM02_10555 [Flavobacterium sp. RSP49]
MSANVPNNPQDQEIDLMQISKRIGIFFQKLNMSLFKCIRFFITNALIISILVVVGVSMGFFFDKTLKTYNHKIIVTPNFGSTDYLYSKIDLINSKIISNDTLFIKEVLGIKSTKVLKKIEIDPIIDIYKFIEDKAENFELLKLMSEDEDVNKIIENNMTSKNYTFHKIFFKTNKLITEEEVVLPILDFLNSTEYYSKVQKAAINNIQIKMNQNDTIISQINEVLNGFSNKANGSQKSDKLVYYNENTQLNDVIKTKDALINEQGAHRVGLISLDRIIKENSTILNIENTTSINGKLKFVLPILLISIFILIRFFIAFYKKQSLKAQVIES